MPVEIHGKSYVTVPERLRSAHERYQGKLSITSEFRVTDGIVICKATLVTADGTFNGTSAANPSKAIEKQNPYEVAETSAVGRALGFAGFGIEESVASADEVFHAQKQQEAENGLFCDYHKVEMRLNKNGNPYHRDANKPEGSQFCNGQGFPDERKDWNQKKQMSQEVDPNDIPF